ncbi:hypothetical protein GQ457_05G021260 [Hibiscus cannabinus]
MPSVPAMVDDCQSSWSELSEKFKLLFESLTSRILLVTIRRLSCPITMEALYRVFSPYGIVEKIEVPLKSVEIQVLVQYQTRQNAISAISSLQGRNIYDGCCHMEIQFCKEPQLTYMVEPKTEKLLKAKGEDNVFDERLVQNDKVKDGENIGVDSGSSNMEFEVNPENGDVMMEDESVETNGGLCSSVASLSVEHSAQLSSLSSVVKATVTEGLDDLFKRLPKPLNVKVPANLDKPIQDLCEQPRPTTRKDVSNIDSNLVTFDVYQNTKVTCNVDTIMLKRILNELSIVTGELSGQCALRDRLKELGYDLEEVQFEKLELECLTKLINANELVCSTDLYRFRLLLMENFDVSDCGKLADFVPLTNYMVEHKYDLCSRIEANAIVVNVYDEGIILRIVTNNFTHATHVAGFAIVYTQISHLNGVAPRAQLISEKIEDSRLCLMETGTKLTCALIDVMDQLCLEVLETVRVKLGISQLRFSKGLIPPLTTFVSSLMIDMLDATMEDAMEHSSWVEFVCILLTSFGVQDAFKILFFCPSIQSENLLLMDNGVLKISEFSLSALPQQTGDDGLHHTTKYVSPEEFVRLFEDVTRNEFAPWEREKKFKKKPLKFHPMDMEDGVDVRCGRLGLRQISVATSHCKLEPRVINFMKVRWSQDIYKCKEVLLEYVKKMRSMKEFGPKIVAVWSDFCQTWFTMPLLFRDYQELVDRCASSFECVQNSVVASHATRYMGNDTVDDPLSDRYKRIGCSIFLLNKDSEFICQRKWFLMACIQARHQNMNELGGKLLRTIEQSTASTSFMLQALPFVLDLKMSWTETICVALCVLECSFGMVIDIATALRKRAWGNVLSNHLKKTRMVAQLVLLGFSSSFF